MLLSPGIGHLLPLIGLAENLISDNNFTVTIIISTIGQPPTTTKSIINSLPEEIKTVFLPPVVFDQTVRPELQIFQTINISLPSIRNLFQSFVQNKTPISTLIVDIFGTDSFGIAKELNIPCYVFGSSALGMTHLLSLSEISKTTSFNNPEAVNLPGCIPIHAEDVPPTTRDPRSETHKFLVHHAGGCRSADGVILNSFMELEPATILALQEDEPGKPKFYPIGPQVQKEIPAAVGGGYDGGDSPIIDWLSKQPTGSVLFVSFGSGGTLSLDQLTELALGLEMSGERFLWVTKSPNEKSALGSYFSIDSETNPLGFLPVGFLGRTKERGMVVSTWAPQLEILGHSSTAGFLTHCGWNSVLESIVNGVPMIAWPLHAEQHINALLVTEGLEVALRPKSSENGLVGREEIAKIIKSLVNGEEGKKILEKVIALKEAAAKALSENGSSTKVLSQLVLKWKNKN